MLRLEVHREGAGDAGCSRPTSRTASRRCWPTPSSCPTARRSTCVCAAAATRGRSRTPRTAPPGLKTFTFNRAMTVTAAGLMAGNSGGVPPAFQARADWFHYIPPDRTAPVVTNIAARRVGGLRRARDVDDGRAGQLGGLVRHHDRLRLGHDHRPRRRHEPHRAVARPAVQHALPLPRAHGRRLRQRDDVDGPDVHQRRLPDAAPVRRVQRRHARHRQVGVRRPARRLVDFDGDRRRAARRAGRDRRTTCGRTSTPCRACCRRRRTPTSRSWPSSTPA